MNGEQIARAILTIITNYIVTFYSQPLSTHCTPNYRKKKIETMKPIMQESTIEKHQTHNKNPQNKTKKCKAVSLYLKFRSKCHYVKEKGIEEREKYVG